LQAGYDGLVVGQASLRPKEFIKIARAAERY